MRHEKNNFSEKTLIFTVFSLIVVIILFLIAYPQTISIIGSAIIDGWATQTTTVSVTIIDQDLNLTVPSSGNVTPSDVDVRSLIPVITGLTPEWQINLTLRGTPLPVDWTAPSSDVAGTGRFEYLEIDVNSSETAGGSYTLYFNLSQNTLGTINPSNVSLLQFNSTSGNWNNLTTVVINGNLDPAQFYGIATHFSRFLIGSKPPVERSGDSGGSPGESGGSAGGGSSGGGGGGGSARESGTNISLSKPPLPPKIPDEREETIPEPVHRPGNYFDVSLTIPSRYRELQPGDALIGEISVINIRKIGAVTVQLEISIENEVGQVFFSKISTKVVENEITFLEEVDLPPDLSPGYYMMMVRVTFETDEAVAGYPFRIQGEKGALVGGGFWQQARGQITNPLFYGAALMAVIVIILGLIALQHRLRSRVEPPTLGMPKEQLKVTKDRLKDKKLDSTELTKLTQYIRKRSK